MLARSKKTKKIGKMREKLTDFLSLNEDQKPENNYCPFYLVTNGQPKTINIEDIYLTNDDLIEKAEKEADSGEQYFYRFDECKRQPGKSWFTKDIDGKKMILDRKIYFEENSQNVEDIIELPDHACLVRHFPVYEIGDVGASKTVTQLSFMVNLQTMLCGHLSMQPDYPLKSEVRDTLQNQMAAFNDFGRLPEPTDPLNNKRQAIIYLCEYQTETGSEKCLLSIHDFAGGAAIQNPATNHFRNAINIEFFIDAGSLIDQKNGRGHNSTNLNIFNAFTAACTQLKIVHVDVIISKFDLLIEFKNDSRCTQDLREKIEAVQKNPTLEIVNDQLQQRVHDKGFDGRAFQEHSERVRDLLYDFDKPLVLQMERTLQLNQNNFNQIDYMAISALGTSPIEDESEESDAQQLQIDITKYKPFNLDIPLMSLLHGFNLIPEKTEEEEEAENETYSIEQSVSRKQTYTGLLGFVIKLFKYISSGGRKNEHGYC